MKEKLPFTPAAIALALGLGASGAHALDYTGYFRAGPGLTSEDASRACYGLNGGTKGMKYRLGNECDFYGEFQLAQGFSKEGIDTKAVLMVNHYTGATDNSSEGLKIEQMWAEAKGFDIAPNATFWIGKERGRRGDVHIVDTFFVEMMGVGAGMKGLPAGTGKFGVAFYKTDSDAAHPGNRFNAEWVDVAANANGKINLFATITKGDFEDGKSGAGLTLRHDQTDLFGMAGLNNVLFVQATQGSAALNMNFGDLTAGSKAKGWRIVESVNWQRGVFGGQAMLLGASETDGAGVRTTSLSAGGRMSYAFTKNFKLVTEAGYSQYKTEGSPTAKLAKLTIAPTLATGPEFWSRPEFRLYVTTAKWNAPAGNVTGQAAFADKTNGTSYGAQVEWWF
ncbi:MAG TPA: carbohydrate porin [Ideonella sp.]|uniref:maltoporin n=1 Tax=Ideonella sp. TaxID=1929293 RepID=UPI002E2F88A4|nr:carbohydrate porin [Ideonella sp.]HEX5684405.1 carbohydrate porin [Ideonella sp.]